MIFALDDRGGSLLLIAGTVGSETKVLNSSICFSTTIPVVGADVSLALARNDH
jgi:hypothetical protein